MNVGQLIEELSALNPDLPVGLVYDGADRIDVECVWLARKGSVLLSDSGHTVYETEDRPESAPTTEEDRYWMTDGGQE